MHELICVECEKHIGIYVGMLDAYVFCSPYCQWLYEDSLASPEIGEEE